MFSRYNLKYRGEILQKNYLKINSATDTPMNQIILISGYPAIGKSTLALKLAKKLNLTYFNKDKDKGKFKKLIKNQIDIEFNFIVEGLYYMINKEMN